jgi:hypothetical protein
MNKRVDMALGFCPHVFKNGATISCPASTFPDVGTADLAVDRALRANLSAFYVWLSSCRAVEVFDHGRPRMSAACLSDGVDGGPG